jgi:Predicted periplasmic/secreted protein
MVELSAQANRAAANDRIQATMSAEASGVTPGELSRQINPMIDEALKAAKTYPSVRAKSGNTSTYPVYTKNGKIESWHMRSEILFESSEVAGLSELLENCRLHWGFRT